MGQERAFGAPRRRFRSTPSSGHHPALGMSPSRARRGREHMAHVAPRGPTTDTISNDFRRKNEQHMARSCHDGDKGKKIGPKWGQLILLACCRLVRQCRGVLSPPPPATTPTAPPAATSTPTTTSTASTPTTSTASTPTTSTAMAMTISTSVCARGPRRGGRHKPRYPGNRQQRTDRRDCIDGNDCNDGT